jgi:hypothetical protein
MSRSSYPLKLPASLKKAAQRLAREDGVSLNQWISVAVAQKVGVCETAAEFLGKRAQGHLAGDIAALLARAPDVAPLPGDEMPER